MHRNAQAYAIPIVLSALLISIKISLLTLIPIPIPHYYLFYPLLKRQVGLFHLDIPLGYSTLFTAARVLTGSDSFLIAANY